jgi:hypothetical protein
LCFASEFSESQQDMTCKHKYCLFAFWFEILISVLLHILYPWIWAVDEWRMGSGLVEDGQRMGGGCVAEWQQIDGR